MDARRFLLSLMIVGAATCLVLGVTLPVMKLTKLYVFSDEHSIASVIQALYLDGEFLLCMVIAVFSLLFPAFKIVYLLAAALAEPGHRTAHRMLTMLEWLGKWSMLDVLVLALTIFYVKSTGLADATSLPGLYFFATAVLLTMIAHGLVKPPVRAADAATAETATTRPGADVQPSRFSASGR